MNTKDKSTEQEQIKNFLQKGGRITPMMALRMYGCMRLAVVIERLRKRGYDIKTEMVTEGNKRFAKYSMN